MKLDCPSFTLYWDKQLSMNWGWHEVDPNTYQPRNNDYNGWFRYDDWTIGNGYNFKYADEMIYHIIPQ